MPTESLTVESSTVESSAAELRPTRRILVFGRVQGLGIRPVAARVARRLRLRGRVANTRDGLAIELQGPPTAVDAFLAEFLAALPAGATVDRTVVDDGPPRSQYATFEIAPRTETGVGLAPVPTDRVCCSACLSELRDPANRRAGYPFISCTDCGPRYSLVEAMPYDRAATSMQPFIMCAACEREYRTPDGAARRRSCYG